MHGDKHVGIEIVNSKFIKMKLFYLNSSNVTQVYLYLFNIKSNVKHFKWN